MLCFSLTACAANPATERPLATPLANMSGIVQAQQWHPIALDFAGPALHEKGSPNPFTDYRLLVTFVQGDKQVTVRGYFAADGDAANTGAVAGNIWRVHFVPELSGRWEYSAQLRTGTDIALSNARDQGQAIALRNDMGVLDVQPVGLDAITDSDSLYGRGILQKSGRYLRFSGNGAFWIKGGANSPENLLGYQDFDGTYRQRADARKGESAIDETLHSYAPHLRDWRDGDPVWRGGRGKGLIGAVNYLADTGMNAAYMLTMNVDGDGKDVWPWLEPDEPSRFDVSKLAQWDIVFAHMQKRGVALHLVMQERENELMLDGGDTGRLRKLYFLEMIARFAHHPALFWNLGEENGPVHWDPQGQNDQQRIAMADFLYEADPYRHPILLHTHAEAKDKDILLSPLLALPSLDGLSFQVAERETVNAETRKWHRLSAQAGNAWLITMDEIGKWQIGAKADIDDPRHDSLRRHALWGHLLAGGAGVEWYFGAHQRGNDLSTEDWRSRAELWRQTRLAMDFFESELPYWQMEPCAKALQAYCFAKPGDIYVYYVGENVPAMTGFAIQPGDYAVRWYDPLTGLFANDGVTEAITISTTLPVLAKPPDKRKDWVAIYKRQ